MQDIAEAIRLFEDLEQLAIATGRIEDHAPELIERLRKALDYSKLADPDRLRDGPDSGVAEWAGRVRKFSHRAQERLEQRLTGKQLANSTRALAGIRGLANDGKRIAADTRVIANSAQSAATSLQKLTTKGKQLRPAEEVVQSQKPSLQNFGNGPNAHARDAQKIAKRALREISEQADAIFKKVKESSRFEATKLRDEIQDFARTGEASRQTKESALEKLRELSKLAS